MQYIGPDRRAADLESAERMARLETHVEALRADLLDITREAKLERKEMMELMQAMRREIVHYKGVIGGIALVFSGVGVVLGLIKGWFVK
jgi:hypothetical protein